MNKLKNNKGFTLVELLAVIVVLAIVMGLAVVGITSVLDNTRKNAFASNAKLFIEGARNLVRSDAAASWLGGSTSYAPACGSTSTINISDIPLDQGGTISPYNSPYTSTSKVVITADASCNYSYAIFLSDGVYAIGSSETPLAETSVNSNAVLPVSGG